MWPEQLTLRSFRFKVILASIVCIVLPVVITSMIYNYLTKDVIMEQAIDNASKELELTDEYVSKLLKDMLQVANFIQIDTEINSILKENVNRNYEDKSDYQQFLSNRTVMKTIENITLVGETAHVTILLENGKSYTNYPISDYDPSHMFQEKWFQELGTMRGFESVWIGSQPTIFQTEKEKNPYQISVARSLRNGKSETYGHVVITIFENKINQIFKNKANQEEIMLLDSSDHILSHTDTNKVGQHFPYLKQKKKAEQTNIITIENVDYLMTEKQVSFVDWKLISLIPYKEAVHKMNSIFSKVFLSQMIFFAIFFGLLTYLINRMTKPLVKLGRVVNDVQKGDLTVRSKINNRDEIGQFSQSFDHMLDRINEMILKTTEIESRKREAELAMLQAQINPHFLFNTLNSIRMKVYKNRDLESAEMISSLSKLLRMTIDDRATIPFQDEVTMIRDYVFLMNMRKNGKVNLHINVSAEASVEKIPRFILQPIIENSIIHGFDQNIGVIDLRAYIKDRKLIIEIKDNGVGMRKSTLQKLKQNITTIFSLSGNSEGSRAGFSGLGLPNVYERMKMTFGSDFNLEIDSSEGKGTKVTLFIPGGGLRYNV